MSKPPPLPRKRRSWGSAVQLALAIWAALLILPVGWYALARIKESRYVKKLEAQIRQKGEPLTLADLAARYPTIPDDQNAAIPLLKIWEEQDPDRWQAFRRNEQPLPERSPHSYDSDLPFLGRAAGKFEPGQKLSPASREAATVFVSEREAHLKAIESALMRTNCRFPVRIGDGFNALVPHLATMKEEAQSLRVHALLAADSGDRDQALDRIEQVLQLSRLLEKEPFLIGQLVQVACTQIAISCGEDLISRGNLSEAQLTRLETMWREINVRPTLVTALKNERVADLSVLDPSGKTLVQIADEGGGSTKDRETYRIGLKVMSVAGITIKDRRLILEHLTALIEAAQQDFPEMFKRQNELEKELEQKVLGFPPKIFARMMLPASGKVIQKFVAVEARKRSALVALEVERYRSGHNGELPKTLDSLEPALSPQFVEDPFDGKPLRFRATENGYVVYSVGANLKDDGGTPVGTRKAKGFDETFRVNFRGVSTHSPISRP